MAIVTGAGSGIGRLVARALLDMGYRVALAGRRERTLEETRAGHDEDQRAIVVPTDVTQEPDVQRLFARVQDSYGRLDLLFNNAGTFGPGAPIEDLSLEDWRGVIEPNLTGAFLCAREAVRLMRRQRPRGGRIINNGSLSAHVPRPRATAYTVSKHALTGLTRQIALEGREHGIACGQIDIGNAATAMTAGMAHGVPQADGTIAPEPVMSAEVAARAVACIAEMPLDATVLSLTLMATGMPYVGRG